MVMGTVHGTGQAMGERWTVAEWGACLFEALTRRRLFVAKNYNALLVQILTADTLDSDACAACRGPRNRGRARAGEASPAIPGARAGGSADAI
jgi:hypothetical protein